MVVKYIWCLAPIVNRAHIFVTMLHEQFPGNIKQIVFVFETIFNIGSMYKL